MAAEHLFWLLPAGRGLKLAAFWFFFVACVFSAKFSAQEYISTDFSRESMTTQEVSTLNLATEENITFTTEPDSTNITPSVKTTQESTAITESSTEFPDTEEPTENTTQTTEGNDSSTAEYTAVPENGTSSLPDTIPDTTLTIVTDATVTTSNDSIFISSSTTVATTTTTNVIKDTSSPLSGGEIAAIVICSIIAVVVIAISVFLIIRYRRQSGQYEHFDMISRDSY